MKKSLLLTILLHVGYWLPSIIQFFIMGSRGGGLDYDVYLLQFRGGTLLALISFYTFYFYLFPRFLQRQQIVKFLIFSGLAIAALCVLGYIIIFFSVYYFDVKAFSKYVGLNGSVYLMATRAVYAAIASCVMRGFVNWFAERSYRRQLEKKNKETSLALLKAQINPHFLFNTLNNIDVLIEKEPVTASAYLKKLSDILRFTLYEGAAETIPVAKEAGYIDQYIQLQKIRTSNASFVSFNITGDTENVQIAPMLFIPFIENAFKHCTNKKLDNAITISVISSAEKVTFSCSNAYSMDAVASHEKSGLGMGLIRSRLDLLYPGKYQMDIDKTADRFTVNLTVNLV